MGLRIRLFSRCVNLSLFWYTHAEMPTNYLKSKTEDGTFDSVGGFTVDAQAAQRTLGGRLFTERSYYLLKFVQAANLAQCAEIRIKSTRRAVEIFMTAPTEIYVDAPDRNPASHALSLGILGLKSLNPSGLSVDEDSSGELSVRAEFVGRSFREVAAEHNVLSRRGRYSSVPLLLGANKLNREGPPDEFLKPMWNSYLPHGHILAEGRMQDPEGHGYLRIALQRKADVFFVRAGVIVAVRQLNLSVPGFQAVVSADHLDTDLSGFQFVENEKYDRLLERLTELANTLRVEVLEGLESLEAQTTSFSLQGKVRWKKSVSGTGLGFVGVGAVLLALTGDVVTGTLLLGAPLLTCATVASASLAGAPVLAPDEKTHQELREQVHRRVSRTADPSSE
jgi:hypothetical protein